MSLFRSSLNSAKYLLLAVLPLGVALACATESGETEDEPSDDEASSSGGVGGVEPPGSGGAAPKPGGGSGGQSVDPGTEEPEPGSAPEPGTPCAQVGQAYERACSRAACGVQRAACTHEKIVSGYGACEARGVCFPGETGNVESCGLCGSSAYVCSESCEWVKGACSGDRTGQGDACTPGSERLSDEGCDAGVNRVWRCGPLCSYLAPSSTCGEEEEPVDLNVPEIGGGELTLGALPSSSSSLPASKNFYQGRVPGFSLTGSQAGSECHVDAAKQTAFAFIEVKNPHTVGVQVRLDVDKIEVDAPVTGFMAAYASKPTSDVLARGCLTGVSGACSGADLCLSDAQQVAIPAQGSIWLYVGQREVTDRPVQLRLQATIVAQEDGTPRLVVGAKGQTVTGIFRQVEETVPTLENSLYFPGTKDQTCAHRGSTSSPILTRHAYVKLENPASVSARVAIYVKSLSSSEPITGVIAAYNERPETRADRAACLNVNSNSGCTSYASCLAGTRAITIPAGGSVWVYVAQLSPSDPARSFQLEVATQ